MAQRCHGLLQALAFGQQQTHLAVAREIAGRSQHQIAQAGQAHEGLGARAQRHAQTRHLGQATCDQGCARVQPQLQAVAKTRGNGQHILDGSADFHAHDVVIGIDAHGLTVKGRHQQLAHALMGAGCHQSRRLLARHLGREAGAAERTALQLRRHLLADFVRHQPIAAGRGIGGHGLEALAQPDHGPAAILELAQPLAQRRHGRAQHNQIGIRHMVHHIAADHRERIRKADAGQIAAVGALGLHELRLRRIPCPEADAALLRMGGRADGHGRTPGASADDKNFHT